jgi:hypothetical protein
MHEMWWSFIGVEKRKISPISDVGFKAFGSKPKFLPKVKFFLEVIFLS